MISVLTLQIKILMMKILWMVTDLPLPVLHHPKLHQAHGETLEWGPPGGSDHPLSGLSPQVTPSPGGIVGSAVRAFEDQTGVPAAWVLQKRRHLARSVFFCVLFNICAAVIGVRMSI